MDTSEWITKPEAARLLNCSAKTLERYADRGEVQAASRPVAGRKPETVYHPDDIGRLAVARQPAAHVMPAAPAAMAVAKPDPFEASISIVSGLIARNEAIAARLKRTPDAARRFMTLPEAAEYSGLSETWLRRAVAANRIDAEKDGRQWKVRRGDVDKI